MNAKNEVVVNINNPVPLKIKGAEHAVFAYGKKKGTLIVRKCGVEWYPKGIKVNGGKFSWDEFAVNINKYGKPCK